MVSFWPWKTDTSSTASFEKTLSVLSAKIDQVQSRLETLRFRSRRARLVTTLYLSFGYLVYAIVTILVIGRAGLGAREWTGLAAGPVVIYAVRYIVVAYYSFRTDSLSSRLKTLQQERSRTIDKLKDATRYNSTLQLLEKYGGDQDDSKATRQPVQTASASDAASNKAPGPAPTEKTPPPTRVLLPPPPTANIQVQPRQNPPPRQNPSPHPVAEVLPGAEFAPNAFSSWAPQQRNWYDRIFDVLLGEDADPADPRNRLALICRSCRRVNGLAPPGSRSLAQVGLWRCMHCDASNEADAEPDEGKRIVKEILEEQRAASPSAEEASAVPSTEQDGVRRRPSKDEI
ncbi:hypothetical protein CDD82_7749 [Ophiocordyceps australis]|uniref:Endoplasmic reticulum junction formation protein lunapark n=1 Tax=Ophiocordyceps australis TaxID=1399860 RepID=A0A2C5XEF0_9HYPO|nr:hypothetical protein CDD82_7749 [Ophiocordyceps australis]